MSTSLQPCFLLLPKITAPSKPPPTDPTLDQPNSYLSSSYCTIPAMGSTVVLDWVNIGMQGNRRSATRRAPRPAPLPYWPYWPPGSQTQPRLRPRSRPRHATSYWPLMIRRKSLNPNQDQDMPPVLIIFTTWDSIPTKIVYRSDQLTLAIRIC